MTLYRAIENIIFKRYCHIFNICNIKNCEVYDYYKSKNLKTFLSDLKIIIKNNLKEEIKALKDVYYKAINEAFDSNIKEAIYNLHFIIKGYEKDGNMAIGLAFCWDKGNIIHF